MYLFGQITSLIAPPRKFPPRPRETLTSAPGSRARGAGRTPVAATLVLEFWSRL